VVLDIAIILIVWQCLCLLLALLSFVTTLDKALMTYFQILNYNPFLVNYIIGIILFFFCLGSFAIIYGMCILMCSCLCPPKEERLEYTYNTYPYYNTPSIFDWIFFYYIFSVWTPYPRPYGCVPVCFMPMQTNDLACFACLISGGNCNFSGGGGGGNGGGGVLAILIGIVIIVVLAVAFIGLIVGFILFSKILYDIFTRRIQIVKRKQHIDLNNVLDLEH